MSAALVAAEASAQHGPNHWAVGVATFAILLVLLFAVTRFNADR